MEKWITDILDSKYCTFLVSLFATIFSFADPMTDIFTLVEFYRDDHKTWFAVGLAFVVLPCVSFFVFMRRFSRSSKETLLCGFNPFSSAWLRLKICWGNFKKCCWDDNSNDDHEDLNEHSALVRLFEAVLESISPSVYYPALCYECATGTSEDHSNDFPICVFPEFSVGFHSS